MNKKQLNSVKEVRPSIFPYNEKMLRGMAIFTVLLIFISIAGQLVKNNIVSFLSIVFLIEDFE